MFGGSLHQDIPKIHPYYHEVINLGLNLVEKSFKVNSTHHQGVKVLASNLVPTLIEPNSDIVESYRDAEDRKVRAVQSHPEFMDEKYSLSMTILNWLFEEV
jgi:gamma-glutamyl-gamma-aminobutyrate hydrolase PuuD